MPRKRANPRHPSEPEPSAPAPEPRVRSPILDFSEYQRLFQLLTTHDSIERIMAKSHYDREFLFVLYTQKRIRHITKNYYRVVNKAQQMRRAWDGGKSFVELANEYDFSPVLTIGLVLRQNGYTKRMVNDILHHPEGIKNRRIKREIRDALTADKLYSPEGNRVQAERGRKGEATIAEWLESIGLEFETENDLRGRFPKTPDFLLKKNGDGFFIRGEEVRWVESKGSFGDKFEVDRNLKRQLSQYLDLFGPGMVIYHFGFVNTIPLTDGIIFETPEIFTTWCQ